MRRIIVREDGGKPYVTVFKVAVSTEGLFDSDSDLTPPGKFSSLGDLFNFYRREGPWADKIRAAIVDMVRSDARTVGLLPPAEK